MSMTQLTNSHPTKVKAFDLAPAILLTSTLLHENEVQIKRLTVSYNDFSIDVEFRILVGIVGDVADEFEISSASAAQMLMELATDKLVKIGIPLDAQQDVRMRGNSFGSWVEIDCTFFLEPKQHPTIDPAVASVIRLDLDFFAAQADLADVLNAKLPVDYAADPDDSIDEKVNCFAQYLTMALPWEAQWLLEYGLQVDFLIQEDVVTFQYQPPAAEKFAYDSSYDRSDANLIIFEFRAIPAIPR